MFKWLKKMRRNSIEDPNVPLTSENIVDYVNNHSPNAMQNPAVWRGVNLISQSVAKLPLITYRRTADGGRERDTDHPAYRLLKFDPSPIYTIYKIKETLQSQAVLHGNAYAYIMRDMDATPIELLILDPKSTDLKNGGGRFYYSTQIENVHFKIPMADVIHIRGLSPDGLTGFAASQLMREALQEGLSHIKYGNAFFKNGAKPSVVIELPANVRDREKIEEFRALWQKNYGGANAHRPAFLRNGSTITTLGGNNETAQLLQLRQHDLILVADFLNVPPHKLGAAISTSYSSLESENKAFLSDCLDGWLVNWEQELSKKLLTENQKLLDTHFIEFERKALLSTDAKTESELLIQDLNNGGLSWQEYRKIKNRPIEKNESEEWRRPANILVGGDKEIQEEAADAVPPPLKNENEETERRLKMLTEDTVDRLMTRLLRSIEAKKYNFVDDHFEVFRDALKAYPEAADISREFLSDIETQIKHALPEQISFLVSKSKRRILGALNGNH